MRLPLELSASIMYMFIFVVTLTPLVTSTVLESQRRADRRYRAIVDRSPAGIFEADTRGRCVYVNRRWSMLSGLTFEQAQGEGWLTAVHPDDRQECARAWRRALERRDEEFVAEFRFLSSVGKEVWVYCTAAALHSDEGRITGYLGTLLDISDRRQAEMELQQAKDDLQQRVAERTGELTQANHELHHQMAERARTEERLQEQQGQLMHVSRLSSLGEMAAGLAHEISQPLYAISNYARGSLLRLRSAAVPPDDIAEPLEQIAGEAERAGEILHRIRAFGRRKPAGQVRIDLNELARDAVRLTAFDARARGVEVQLQLSNDLPPLVSDPIQIQQVLVNLLRNAYEAVEDLPQARRCVTIETFRNRTEAGCAVHDRGAGLPADRHRLFEPFFTTKPQGLGLGLAISCSLIESFGGRLWVEPGSTGGATFRFTLPGAENGHDVGDCRADRVSGG
jgi:PAS domain S-box-containing protein